MTWYARGMLFSGVDLPDKDDLKRRVPLAAVCAALGVRLDAQGYGLCPFHEDSRPSFNLWVAGDGTQRWGCFPCGINGDCFSLVQRLRLVSFGEAIRFVSDLSAEVPQYTPPEPVLLDREALEAYVLGSQRRALEEANVGLMCVAADLLEESDSQTERLKADARLRDLGWGVDDRFNVVMPHYRPTLEIAGAKIRPIGGKPRWSFPGSSYDRLYGCWRSRRGKAECILVEGETDYAHALLENLDAHVLSLPTGAGGYRDSWRDELLSFDRLYLAFDGDDAGEAAAARWSQHLAIVSDEIQTLVLPIPRGEDLRSCGVPVSELMEVAWTVG